VYVLLGILFSNLILDSVFSDYIIFLVTVSLSIAFQQMSQKNISQKRIWNVMAQVKKMTS